MTVVKIMHKHKFYSRFKPANIIRFAALHKNFVRFGKIKPYIRVAKQVWVFGDKIHCGCAPFFPCANGNRRRQTEILQSGHNLARAEGTLKLGIYF